MAERLDILIFGATGFTGKRCIPEVHRFSKLEGQKLTWGIAGRSEQKLKTVLQEMEKTCGDLQSIPIIIADVKDEESLKQMTAKAKVLLNCCGPYRFFGEPVVKACIETGTHYLDVSGEPQFMERMQLEYDVACKEKGIYVVSACGFDSIPADLGVIFTEKKFEGTLNSVESFLEAEEEEPKTPGPVANYGTWESLVYSVSHVGELRALRSKLFPTKLPPLEPKLKSRGLVHKTENGKWALPFLGSDRSVIIRSQRILYEQEKKRPVQIQTYFTVNSFLHVIAFAIFGAILGLLTRFKFGVSLLLKYPALFSFGAFTHGGPPEEKQKKTKFSITFYGKGWSEKLAEPEDKYKQPPNKSIITRVSASDPAYGVTCTALILCGITILSEKSRLPANGGVFPPGAAFAKTSLIDQLNKNGLKFEVLSTEEIKEN